MNEYRRNLPHIHPDAATFFITFNLAGTLPRLVVQQITEEFEAARKALLKLEQWQKDPTGLALEIIRERKRQFVKYERILDKCQFGHHWLDREDIASIVANKLFALDGQRYELLAFCIMPNHVHLLFKRFPNLTHSEGNAKGKTLDKPVADTMRIIKGATARLANQALGREEAFWHHESYDHFIRNENELHRIIEYILLNPVKAGLVKNWKDWRWTYLHEKFRTSTFMLSHP